MDLWRVQAVEANTTLSTVPPIAGLDGVTLTKKGEWAEAMTTESFELREWSFAGGAVFGESIRYHSGHRRPEPHPRDP